MRDNAGTLDEGMVPAMSPAGAPGPSVGAPPDAALSAVTPLSASDASSRFDAAALTRR